MIDVFNAFQSEKVSNNCEGTIIIKKLGIYSFLPWLSQYCFDILAKVLFSGIFTIWDRQSCYNVDKCHIVDVSLES